MIVQQMNKLGISSDVLQVAGFASIIASIATWRTAKGSGDIPHAERFGIEERQRPGDFDGGDAEPRCQRAIESAFAEPLRQAT